MLVQRRGDDHHDWKLYHGDGRIDIEWYFRRITDLPTSVMLYHLEPGAEEGSHFHLEDDPRSCSEASEDEVYIVVVGEVVMTVDEERSVLSPGDAVYVPAGVSHGLRNNSASAAEVLLLFGPPDGNPLKASQRSPKTAKHG